MWIQTKQQYFETICAALDLTLDDDQGTQALVHMKARNCPVCGAKPRLFSKRYHFSKLLTSGLTRDYHVIGAGVILCGCGRSGMFFDERGGVESQDERVMYAPDALTNKLIDTWNARS